MGGILDQNPHNAIASKPFLSSLKIDATCSPPNPFAPLVWACACKYRSCYARKRQEGHRVLILATHVSLEENFLFGSSLQASGG